MQPSKDMPYEELPTWAAFVIGIVVAVGSAMICLVFEGENQTHDGGAFNVGRTLAFSVPCFLGTSAFAVLAPSRRWNGGMWLGGCLVVIASVLAFLVSLLIAALSHGSSPVDFGTPLAVLLATAIASALGLRLVPRSESVSVRLIPVAVLLAVAAGAAVVSMALR